MRGRMDARPRGRVGSRRVVARVLVLWRRAHCSVRIRVVARYPLRRALCLGCACALVRALIARVVLCACECALCALRVVRALLFGVSVIWYVFSVARFGC